MIDCDINFPDWFACGDSWRGRPAFLDEKGFLFTFSIRVKGSLPGLRQSCKRSCLNGNTPAKIHPSSSQSRSVVRCALVSSRLGLFRDRLLVLPVGPPKSTKMEWSGSFILTFDWTTCPSTREPMVATDSSRFIVLGAAMVSTKRIVGG
jgi:hypothetical protein